MTSQEAAQYLNLISETINIDTTSIMSKESTEKILIEHF
jgi:hypothetical protein